ncbi:hypothetical protein BDA99DRAFT_520254 [Phascolomyces articulosus]|uniref:Galactose oxidase n=1 Tax=Phascolomyces articulosus TaxID=60185 RepID=A0AAD5JT94_9FUNG|nr:hypothetical protein BDA99DRAFT_520254 [Phascolomyces articulosus]
MNSLSAMQKLPRKSLLLLLLLTSRLLVSVHGLASENRGQAACAYMSSEAKIYCYGGYHYNMYTEGVTTAFYSQYFISLNMTQGWQSNTDIENGWEHENQDYGLNFYTTMVAVPYQKILFMDGGAGTTETGELILPRFKSAYIDIEANNGWAEVNPSRNGSGVSQHTAVLGSDNNTIYIWGGSRNHWSDGRPVGQEEYPREMSIFNIKDWKWTTGNMAEQGRLYHSVVCVGPSIYYIGGIYGSPSGVTAAPMDVLSTFNTDSGEWQNRDIGGSITPSTRVRHTTTLKPSTGEVILFGGQDPNEAYGFNNGSRDDYFYILNTQGELSWSTRTLQEDGGSFGGYGIHGHCAVLAEDYLFIMFGFINYIDQPYSFNTTNKIWGMDVNKWSWVSSINAMTPESIPEPIDTTGSTPGDDGKPNSISTGAIVGAAVGGVVGVAIIAGIVAFFCIRRKKRHQLNEKAEQKSRMLSNDEIDPPPVNNLGYYKPNSPYHSQGNSSTEVAHSRDHVDLFISQEQVQQDLNISTKPDGLVAAHNINISRSEVQKHQKSSKKKSIKPDGQ